jgi:transposase
MDFQEAAKLGNYLAKDYAENFFALLVNYRNISASEAASRLGLHIRTAQDFLEAMASLGILTQEEVYEKKRPYFRYTLMTERIQMDLDLTQIQKEQNPADLDQRIREKTNAGANFSLARGGELISHVSLWTGSGRDRKERKISLTQPQGLFLYHLPFPNAEALTIAEIARKAGVNEEVIPEILDIVDLLEKHEVIEVLK